MIKHQSRLFTKIILISFVLLAIYTAYMIFFPRLVPNQRYMLLVNKGESLTTISNQLGQDQVINNQRVFRLLIKLSGKDKNVAAGIYVFKNSTSLWEIVKRLVSGKPDQFSITILDGWTIRDLRAYVDKLPYIQHLSAHLTDTQLKDLLKIKVPNLEGLFYPSTYFIVPNQTDLEIYQNAYRLMQNRLNQLYAKRNGNTKYADAYQMLIMASLIQKETSNPKDMYMISTVFNNRLRIGMKLQDDPSVFYGLQNRDHIEHKDFQIDTPYNTYIHYGLPPSPICIPSDAALIAAGDPNGDPKLLYFIATGGGGTKFSGSYKEHQTNVNRYLHK